MFLYDTLRLQFFLVLNFMFFLPLFLRACLSVWFLSACSAGSQNAGISLNQNLPNSSHSSNPENLPDADGELGKQEVGGQSGQGSLDQGLEVGRSWLGLEKFLQREPAVGKWLEAALSFSLSDLRAFSATADVSKIVGCCATIKDMLIRNGITFIDCRESNDPSDIGSKIPLFSRVIEGIQYFVKDAQGLFSSPLGPLEALKNITLAAGLSIEKKESSNLDQILQEEKSFNKSLYSFYVEDQGLKVAESWLLLQVFLVGKSGVREWLELALNFSLSDLSALSRTDESTLTRRCTQLKYSLLAYAIPLYSLLESSNRNSQSLAKLQFFYDIVEGVSYFVIIAEKLFPFFKDEWKKLEDLAGSEKDFVEKRLGQGESQSSSGD
jgi:hypothetical protein